MRIKVHVDYWRLQVWQRISPVIEANVQKSNFCVSFFSSLSPCLQRLSLPFPPSYDALLPTQSMHILFSSRRLFFTLHIRVSFPSLSCAFRLTVSLVQWSGRSFFTFQIPHIPLLFLPHTPLCLSVYLPTCLSIYVSSVPLYRFLSSVYLNCFL